MRDEPQQRRRGLAKLAGCQHGVVSVGQLKTDLGWSRSAISRAVADGVLHRLHRGVYASGHTDVSDRGLCLAAVLTAGDGALLSHYSAAWLWGLRRGTPFPVHVVTPVARAQRDGFVLHRASHLHAEDRAEVGPVPVTSVARTLLDMAALLRPDPLRRMLQRAEELRLFDLRQVEAVLARNRGHSGRAPLQHAIDLYRPPRFTRSGLERDFLSAVERAGLPDPVTGWVELSYELDVYWPDHQFVVELDVFETHGTRESFESDRLRREDLKLAGIESIRVTGRRFEREPRQVVERVATLLSQRARSLVR